MHVLQESLHIPQCNGTVGNFDTTHDCYKNITDVVQEDHERHDDPRNKLGLPSSIIKGLVLTFKIADFIVFTVETLDDDLAAISLFNLVIQQP